MERRLLAVLLCTAALMVMRCAPPAEAGVRVYVGVPPPPVIVETVPVLPSPRHVWIPGYHRWDGQAHVWVPGQYVVAPRPRAVWAPGHWVQHRRGWYWREGHWR